MADTTRYKNGTQVTSSDERLRDVCFNISSQLNKPELGAISKAVCFCLFLNLEKRNGMFAPDGILNHCHLRPAWIDHWNQ